MSQTDDLFLVDDFLASWDNGDNNEPISSCWQVSNTTLTMENGASLLLEDLLQCDEQLLNIPSPMDTTTTTFTLPSSSSSAVACLVEQQTTASQQQTQAQQQDAAAPTTPTDHVQQQQQQQEVENCFRIVRSKKEQHDMTVLYACTELDSPKTNTSKTKKNPSHCIVAKNEKLTAQFYNNFQVVEQQQQGEAILSLKLGFQQKLFLTCETHLVQIKIVSCDGMFVAFSKVIPMQMGAALFVFQVQDREQVRNMPFDIKFFDASQGQVLGKISSVLLQPQYKYNAMKRKLAAVASNGEQQQQQPPSKKQRLV